MALPPTQDELKTLFLNIAIAADPDADISDLTDYEIKGTVYAGVGAGLAQDAYQKFNNTYPQFSNSQGINLQLAAAGIPITYPASQALLTLTGNDLVVGETYNVPLGTILTAPNGATYKVISSTNSNLTNVIVTTINPTLYIVSNATGQNTGQATTTILTITPPVVSVSGAKTLSTCTVIESTDGANQETLANATKRLVQIKQTPLCGTRKSDFKNEAINSSNSVTDAIVLINNQLVYTNKKWNVGIYDISGSPITDAVLNQGLLPSTTAIVFSRTTGTIPIATTQEIMNNLDIVGAFPIVSTVSTQQITALTGSPHPFFRISVSLQYGYSLATNITLTEGTFTLYQLIQREVRRAICSQPYGSSLESNSTNGILLSSTLPTSSIEQQLDLALGTPNTTGTLGTYLKDRTVYTWSGSAYIYNPSISLSLSLPVADADKLGWIYDISLTPSNIYPNISVQLV